MESLTWQLAEARKIKAEKAALLGRLGQEMVKFRDLATQRGKLCLERDCKLLQVQTVKFQNQDSVYKRDELSK